MFFPRGIVSSCWSPLMAEGKSNVHFKTFSWKVASVECKHKQTAVCPVFWRHFWYSGQNHCLSLFVILFGLGFFIRLFLFFIKCCSVLSFGSFCLYWFRKILILDILQYFSSCICASSEVFFFLIEGLWKPWS